MCSIDVASSREGRHIKVQWGKAPTFRHFDVRPLDFVLNALSLLLVRSDACIFEALMSSCGWFLLHSSRFPADGTVGCPRSGIKTKHILNKMFSRKSGGVACASVCWG